MYQYDYGVKKGFATSFTVIVPLIMFLFMYFLIQEEIFFKTIGITGGIAASLEGIMIILMYRKAKKLGDRKPEYELNLGNNKILSIFLIMIFIIGMLFTIIEFFGVL